MRYLILAAALSGCSSSLPGQLDTSISFAAPEAAGADMANSLSTPTASSSAPDMTASGADAAPSSASSPSSYGGVALGGVCTVTQDCSRRDYGWGRCVIDVTGIGHCTTALTGNGYVNYCLSTSPSNCCLSTNVNSEQGTSVTGVYADWATGTPTGAGVCNFGTCAPWGNAAP